MSQLYHQRDDDGVKNDGEGYVSNHPVIESKNRTAASEVSANDNVTIRTVQQLVCDIIIIIPR